jgi:hypothetical protein
MVLDFFENNLHFLGIFDQCLDRGRKQGSETLELWQSSTWL